MSIRSTILTLGVGLYTALILAGSIVIVFFVITDVLAIPTMFAPLPIKVIVGLSVLVIPFFGGWFWGAGIAILMRKPVKTLAKTAMFSWGGSTLIAAILLDFTQIPIFEYVSYIRFSRHTVHFLFTFVFVITVGIVTRWNVSRILQGLGLDELHQKVGNRSGLAAAGAFLVISLVLLYAFDWEVAGPFAGRRYSMILIMHVCNVFSALAGGTVLGWTLRRVETGTESSGEKRASLVQVETSN